jgi:DNA-binding transcriptional LysR family regulator
MINSLAIHWWVPRVEAFQQQAPNIDVRLSNLPHVFSLEKEGIDVALIHGNAEQWQDYYCEKLADDELVLVCSPDLLTKANGASIKQLLESYPAIYAENVRRKDDWQTWCEHQGYQVPPQSKNLTFSLSVYAVQAAIRKLGILVTHRLFVRDDIKHQMLVEIGHAVKNPHQDFYFVCAPHNLKQESVLTIRTWLRKAFSHDQL